MLIDAGDVIVHVFRPEVREFYQLEKMWMPQPAARPQPADTVSFSPMPSLHAKRAGECG